MPAERGLPLPASLVPGAARSRNEALFARLAAAAKAACAPLEDARPAAVIVVECVGVRGGPRCHDGNWSRVVVDLPEPLPLLTSMPGSSIVPLGVHAQGLRVLLPCAGEDWAPRALSRLRGRAPRGPSAHHDVLPFHIRTADARADGLLTGTPSG